MGKKKWSATIQVSVFCEFECDEDLDEVDVADYVYRNYESLVTAHVKDLNNFDFLDISRIEEER